MNQSEELLNRIKVLEHENSVLQQTINELQEYQQYNQPSNGIFSFHRSPMDYIVGDFWLQPANNYWNLTKRRARRRNTLFSDFRQDFPWMVSDDGNNFGYGFFVAEDIPEEKGENEELRQKVGELKQRIEKLERKLEKQNSPLVHVANAIKETARYDSPSAAYELFKKQDYIFKDCDQWKENVKDLKDFLLREKNRATLPPPTSMTILTNEQMADAISGICGENLPLDDKQKWLGVCCLLRARYGYPYDIEACCKRLAALPYKTKLYKECDYGNVRKLAIYGFSREPYEKWKDYCPKDSEKKYFDSCFYVARELECSIEKIINND